MAGTALHVRSALTIVASVLLVTGCATVDKQLAEIPDDVTPTRNVREEEAVTEFEQTRDSALYQAALARWRDGDAVESESLLTRLLQRNDEHREARLMLADLYAATGKSKAAEQHLRLLIERKADDAQAHHSLGMLLDMTGKVDEAQNHLQKAAELEPENELYAISLTTTQADSNAPPDRPKSSRRIEAKATAFQAEIDG